MIRLPWGAETILFLRAVMSNFFTTPAVQIGATLVVLGVLIAGAFYLLASFRDYTAEDQETIDGVLANLQEMHRKGDISDEEFRTIEATTHWQLEQRDERGDSSTDETSPKT